MFISRIGGLVKILKLGSDDLPSVIVNQDLFLTIGSTT